MIRNYLSALAVLLVFCFKNASSQANFIYLAPMVDNSTALVAPGTQQKFTNGCFLVKNTELAGMSSGTTTITAIGFTLQTGAVANSNGTISLYLENTGDATYNKGTAFYTAINTMSLVYSGAMNLPLASGATSVMVNLATPFVYTGAGLYVAFEWNCPSGTPSNNPAIFRCNSSGMTIGGAYANGGTPPPTIATVATRPSFLFNVANSFTNDIAVVNMDLPGKVAFQPGTAHNITATIKNTSNQTRNNILVSANAGGANTFASTQNIGTLTAGAATVLTFPFTPANAGVNTISVTVPADQKNTNNALTYTQNVTCNQWALHPPVGSFTNPAVGFLAGGIIASQYSNTAAGTITGLNIAVGSDVSNVSKDLYGVVLDAGGNIVATSNTITLTNTLLGTFTHFDFTPPLLLSANTTYYTGLAQTAASVPYYPFATMAASYNINGYFSTSLTGGALNPQSGAYGYFGIEAVFQSTVNIPAVINAPTISCGTTTVISATTNATSYTWSAGPANANYVVSPLATTVYSLVVQNIMGCTNTHTTMVTVSPVAIAATSNATAICAGNHTVTISASGASTYTWNTMPPTSAASFTVNPSVTTVYSVQAQNASGCFGSATVTLTVNSFSNLAVSANNGTACAGQAFNAAASGGTAYTWTDGSSVFNTAAITQTLNANTTYTVSGTNANGCSSSTVINITVSPSPTLVVASVTVNCGTPVTLMANASHSYTWTNGPANANYVITPLSSAIYSVTTANNFNCSISRTVGVNVTPISVTATSNSPTICVGGTVALSASGAATYSWNTSPIINGSSFIASPAVTTVYSVTGIAANGCSASAFITVTVSACTGTDTPTGIETNSITGHVKVYPNPFNSSLILSFDNVPAFTDIIVTNILGEAVLHMKQIDKNSLLDLSSQAQGVYLIKIVQNGTPVRSIKAIKE